MTAAEIIARIREAGEVERSMPRPRGPAPVRSAHPAHNKTLQEAIDGLWALVKFDADMQPIKAEDGTYLTHWGRSWTQQQGADRAAIDRYTEALGWLASLGQHNPRWRLAVWACYGQGWNPQMASTRMVGPLWRQGLLDRKRPPHRDSVRQWRDAGVNWIAQHLVGGLKKSA